MKFILFLFLVLCITSCTSPQPEDISFQPTKGSLANEVRHRAFVQLKIEKGLRPRGVGAQMMDQIKMLALAFGYYKEVDIEEARELLVYAGRVFLGIINENEQIRPLLDNYPFKPENIQIQIVLQKPNGSEVSPGKLCIVTMRNGILNYKTDSPEGYTLLTTHEETYEEAVSRLNAVAESAQL
jgi:hypothetical protein